MKVNELNQSKTNFVLTRANDQIVWFRYNLKIDAWISVQRIFIIGYRFEFESLQEASSEKEYCRN